MRAENLGKRTQVNVLLPRQHSQNLRTLWLLHGMTNDHTSWLVSSCIESLAEEYGIAVVMPNADLSFYVDMAYGADYDKFIAEELPSYLGRYFPLSQDKKDNFIGGLSMGGYGSFAIALNHPDKYAAAVSLSGPMYIPWIYATLTDVTLAQAADSKDKALLDREVESYVARTGIPRHLVNCLMGDAGMRTRRTFLAMYGENAKLEGTRVDIPSLCKKLKESGTPLKLIAYCGTEDLHYESNIRFSKDAEAMGLDYSLKCFPGAHTWAFWNQCTPEVLQRLFGSNQ